MPTNDLVIGIQVSGDGRSLRLIERDLNRLRQATDRNTQAARRSAVATDRQAGAARRAIRVQGGFLGLLREAVPAAIQFARTSVDAGLAMERWEARLSAATRSQAAAKREIGFLRSEAERLGLDFSMLADHYSSFALATRGTNLEGRQTREIFVSVAEAARVLRLDADELDSVMAGLTQRVSKSTDDLPKFARELRSSVASGLPDAVSGAEAAFARLDNAIEELQQSIAGSGLLDFLAGATERLTAFIRGAAGLDRPPPASDLGLDEARTRLTELRETLPERIRNRLDDSDRDGPLRLGRKDSRDFGKTVREIKVLNARILELTLTFQERVAAVDRQIEEAEAELDAASGQNRRAPRNRLRNLRTQRSALFADRRQRSQRSRGAIIGGPGADLQPPTPSDDLPETHRPGPEEIETTRTQAEQLAAIEKYEARLLSSYERERRAARAARDETLAFLDDKAEGFADAAFRIDRTYRQEISRINTEEADAEERRAEARRREVEQDRVEKLKKARDPRSGAIRALSDLEKKATDSATNVENAFRNGFQAMENALVNFVKTGKLSFGDFVDTIISDLARIVIRQQIIGPLASALGSLFAGGGQPPVGIPLGAGTANAGVVHAGGIVGALGGISRVVPLAAFHDAQSLHRGGIAGLRTGEVPAILRRGEGVFTPEQMSALGPASGPIEVRVVNESSQPVRAREGRAEFDGRKLVVSTVVEDIAQGGGIGRALEGEYGLRRRPA